MKRIFSILFLALLLLPLPARADRLSETVKRLTPYAVKGMEQWHVPGLAMAVVKGETVVWAKGLGTRRAGTDLPVSPDTVFQVGSTTKAFTVAVMATLADEGKTGWDDRVIDHFPGFRLHDPWVTREFRIHDLFAQHSGMPAYAGDAQAFLGYGRDHIIASMRHVEPVYSFRDQFSYVNNLFVAGAKVEELLTGKPWETLVRERILDPLSMTRSSLDEAGLTKADDGASLHVLVNGEPVVIEPGTMLRAWPYVYGPAGGLNSTALDMARWAAAQLNRGKLGKTRIFSREAADYMHTPRTPVKMGPYHAAYTQGWMLTELSRTDVIWHNGGTSGICAFVGFSPDLDAAFVALTNLGGHNLADALGMQFFDWLSGKDDADWSATFLEQAGEAEEAETGGENTPNLPGLPPERYAGTYHSPVLGGLTVASDGKDLVIRLGARFQEVIRAGHATMHTFAGEWPSMDPDDPVYHFDFAVTPEGEVTGVTLREFDYDGCGLFERR
jgi:CubicO group peptidase (beta-lactamase class C family)